MSHITPNRLRELRARVRLTQEEVAKIVDLHFTTVSKHESMTRPLSPKDVEAYAKLYKVDSYEIFMEPLPELPPELLPGVGSEQSEQK